MWPSLFRIEHLRYGRSRQHPKDVHAPIQPEGLILRGANNKWWQVKQNKRGTKTWKLVGTLMISSDTCPYCDQAKETLRAHNIKYQIRNVKQSTATMNRNTFDTVPQIWIKSKYIGGYDDLMNQLGKSQ